MKFRIFFFFPLVYDIELKIQNLTNFLNNQTNNKKKKNLIEIKSDEHNVKLKEKASNYSSMSIDIEAICKQISYIFLQKLLSRLSLPPYHIDPSLRQFNQRLTTTTFKKKNSKIQKFKSKILIYLYIIDTERKREREICVERKNHLEAKPRPRSPSSMIVDLFLASTQCRKRSTIREARELKQPPNASSTFQKTPSLSLSHSHSLSTESWFFLLTEMTLTFWLKDKRVSEMRREPFVCPFRRLNL